jgi:hypothetical protein
MFHDFLRRRIDQTMFRFLMGVAFGAAGYWAWQSFGRDLLGMGNDQDTSYAGFNNTTTGSGFGSSATTGGGFSSTTTAPSNSTSTSPTTSSTGSSSGPTATTGG